MSDEQTNKQANQTPPSGDPWQEVGRQFQILGESLAAAVRSSWNDPEHRKRIQAMQGNLENMVREVDLAIQDAAKSPQARQAREEAKRAAESLRDASEQTVQDVRPHLLAALKQVNEELQRVFGHLDGSSRQKPPSSEEDKK